MTKNMLSEKDRLILREVDRNVRIPLTLLAKRARLSRQAVKRRLHKLRQAGYVRNILFLTNVSKIGYNYYRVHLKFDAPTPPLDKKLRDFCVKNTNVCWLVRTEGPCDYILGAMHRSDAAFYGFTKNLRNEFADKLQSLEFVAAFSAIQLTKTFSAEMPPVKGNWIGGAKERLDELDLKIIGVVTKDARAAIVDIAKGVGTTPETVRRRLSELIKKGIVVGYLQTDFAKLGLRYFKTLVFLRKHAQEKAIVSFLRNYSFVRDVMFCLGSWQMEINVEVEDVHEYYEMLDRLREKFVDSIEDCRQVEVRKEYFIDFYPMLKAA